MLDWAKAVAARLAGCMGGHRTMVTASAATSTEAEFFSSSPRMVRPLISVCVQVGFQVVDERMREWVSGCVGEGLHCHS